MVCRISSGPVVSSNDDIDSYGLRRMIDFEGRVSASLHAGKLPASARIRGNCVDKRMVLVWPGYWAGYV